MAVGRVVAVFVFGVSVTGCLPNDTRPAPGSVLVNVTSDGVVNSGIPPSGTADRWDIAFERVLVSIGYVDLDGDHCTVYSDSNYGRIIDMSVEGPQKVSLVYGLGHCGFGFRVSYPNAYSVLGSGAAEMERNAMRVPTDDDYVDESGIGIYVRGRASKDDVTKTFEWAFRLRANYRRCVTAVATAGEGVVLASNEAQTVDISFRPGALFGAERNLLSPSPRFQDFADADSVAGNDDGVVTLDELGRVPLAQTPFADVKSAVHFGEFADIDASYVDRLRRVDGGWAAPVSLEDYVYLVLFPKTLRFAGTGSCAVQLSTRSGNG